MPESYRGREDEPEIAQRIVGENSFFKSRRASIDGQKNQLHERILQLRQEITGLTEQIQAKADEIVIVDTGS